jgi:predicted ATPase with chaperone activity
VPELNAREAAMVGGVEVYPVKSLLDVIRFVNTGNGILPLKVDSDTLLSEAQHYAVDFKDVRGQQTANIRERVMRAREIQLQRFSSSRSRLYCNAQMPPRHIRASCELSTDCERLLERAMTQHGMTPRAHDRILKVARTVADLEGAPAIEPKHIAEAIQYRTLDRTFWA